MPQVQYYAIMGAVGSAMTPYQPTTSLRNFVGNVPTMFKCAMHIVSQQQTFHYSDNES